MLREIKLILVVLFSVLFCITACKKEDSIDANGVRLSQDRSDLLVWKWDEINLPLYNWQEGVTFGNNLHVDAKYDYNGVQIVDDVLRFNLDPNFPIPAATATSPHNFRSEIRTAPWEIKHPIETEQWIGWRYTFGDDYVIDPTSPITIFQNHPGIEGESPVFEIEIAKASTSNNTSGGEIQVVNKGVGDRISYDVQPMAGESLDIVVHVIYGKNEKGLLQVWLDGVLVYDKIGSTVYDFNQWGGNNKWGIYHHTFYNNPESVEASLNLGAGKVELLMGTLKMLTRSQDHPEHRTNAFRFVDPDQ